MRAQIGHSNANAMHAVRRVTTEPTMRVTGPTTRCVATAVALLLGVLLHTCAGQAPVPLYPALAVVSGGKPVLVSAKFLCFFLSSCFFFLVEDQHALSESCDDTTSDLRGSLYILFSPHPTSCSGHGDVRSAWLIVL